MKLRPKKQQPVGRRRPQLQDEPVAASYSYHKKRSEQPVNTGRNTKREQLAIEGRRLGNFWLQRFGLLILLIVVAIALINVAAVSPHAKIVALNPQSETLLQDESVYQAAIDKLLAATPANRTKLTIDSATISSKFSAQFPEVASASLVLPVAAHRPILYIEPSKPAIMLAAHGGSFVLDTTGRVLVPSTKLPSTSKLTLPVVTDQSNLEPKVGSRALSGQAVQNIRAIIGQLSARNVTLSSLTLPAGTSELDATVSDEPYQVKFNLQKGNARQQAGTFLAVQAELKRTNVTPAKYIDVRVDGRAYYE